MKKIFDMFKRKSANEERESYVKEKPEAYGTGKYAAPDKDDISVTEIQNYYHSSNLLKKYIKVIVDEIMRYELIAVPKKDAKAQTKAKRLAKEVNDLFLTSNERQVFSEIREEYIKDLLLYGRSGVELEPTEKDQVQAMYAVPGYAIKLNTDETGSFSNPEEAYSILDPNDMSKEPVATFPYNSFVYFVWDKMSDKVYGDEHIYSIYREIEIDINASKNLSLGNNSVKTGVLSLPKANKKIMSQAIERLSKLCNQNGIMKVVAVNLEGKFIDMSNLTPKDYLEIQKHVTKKANIFNIPPFKLGMSDDSGSLNAREQKDAFKAMIENIVKYEIKKWNSILIRQKLKYGDDIEIISPSLATNLDYQRTRIATRLVSAGIITPNEARVKYLSLDESDDPEANKLQQPRQQSAE